MPVEKAPELTEEEWLFQLLLATPSIFSEWIRPHIEGEGFKLWPKQIMAANMVAKKKKKLQGRFLGKTIGFSDEFKQACITWTKPVGVALFATRQESNLEPVFNRELAGAFQRVPFLRLFLRDGDKGINRKTWTINLQNGVVIRGRIEGKEGAGFQTIHPDVIAWWDEVQLLSDEAVAEAYGMLSDETPRLASGVPNGVRSSWAYRIDTDPAYGFQGIKMCRHDDPRYTEEMDQELIAFYGGKESSGYLNRVEGEWGADSRMTFDLDRITMDLPTKDGSAVTPPFYRSLELHARDIVNDDGTAKVDVLYTRFSFRGDMPKTNKVLFHADYGQSASPTSLYITFWDVKENCWRTYHRVLLYGMESKTQAHVVHWLADQIKRMTGVEPTIGFDASEFGGSNTIFELETMGHPVMRIDTKKNVDTHDTRPETDDEYRKRLAKDPFGPRDRMLVPIQLRWRQVAFPRLAREFYSGRLRLVAERPLLKQIAGTTDYQSKTNDRIYETDYTQDGKPYDHDLMAFEILGAMLHLMDDDVVPAAPKAWSHPVDIGWGVMDAV